MPQSFDVQVAAGHDGSLVARVSGELDLTARTALVDAVTEPLGDGGAVKRLALDLERVTFCDSSGLGALLDIRRASNDAGVDMVLRNVPLPVARLLDLTDVDGWLRRE
jgi:anti-sigma B factor antagonist